MEQTLKIGLIVKPQGIRGQLKVQPLTDDINRFNNLKEVIIENKTYRVEKSVIGGGMVFVSLFGLSDRNMAETFRGKYISVTRENALPLDDGRYFIVDIIGCSVKTDEGKIVGKVTDVTSARTDILTLNCEDNRVMRFPFLKDLIVSVDIDKKEIVLKGKRLDEVSVYED